MAQPGFEKVADVGDLSPGDIMSVDVGDGHVLLANVDGAIYAIDDICSHAYAFLSDGDLSGNEVECPLHGSAFNVITGECLTPPADENQKSFQVEVDGNDILVGPAKE